MVCLGSNQDLPCEYWIVMNRRCFGGRGVVSGSTEGTEKRSETSLKDTGSFTKVWGKGSFRSPSPSYTIRSMNRPKSVTL